MKGIMRHELSCALRNPWFVTALVIACVLATAAAVECKLTFDANREQILSYGHQLDLNATFYMGQTRESSFGNWIIVGANAPLSGSLFFYTLPILAVVPFAWSFRSEMTTGYAAQIETRTSRGSYLTAKYVAVFITGALIALVPLVLNFIEVSCLFPAYMPRSPEYNYVGLFENSFFARQFYSQPLLHVVLYTLLDTALLGAWAAFVLGASCVLRDRVQLMVVPYVALLAWHYFNGWFFSTFMMQGFNMNLISSLQSESTLCQPEIRATLAELALLLLFGAMGAYLLTREEVK